MDTDHNSTKDRTIRDYLIITLKGMCMGAADVVPGVSGGTIAFITGIYEELLDSIKSIDLRVIKLLFSLKLMEIFKIIRWQFLLSVLIGILFSVFSLAKGIAWLLENKPVLLWSFFFGLVFASVFVVGKRITNWNISMILAAVISVIGTYILVGLVPLETPNALWFVFLSGMIAICAMILPGISGSFILVLLGKYQYILGAVNNRDFLTLGIFAAGTGIGIISFARVLSWLFKRYRDLTVAILTGLMLGSLRKVWPWKKTISTIVNRHGKEIPTEQLNVLPAEFSNEVILAVGFALLGFAIVILLESFASQKSKIDPIKPG